MTPLSCRAGHSWDLAFTGNLPNYTGILTVCCTTPTQLQAYYRQGQTIRPRTYLCAGLTATGSWARDRWTSPWIPVPDVQKAPYIVRLQRQYKHAGYTVDSQSWLLVASAVIFLVRPQDTLNEASHSQQNITCTSQCIPWPSPDLHLTSYRPPIRQHRPLTQPQSSVVIRNLL